MLAQSWSAPGAECVFSNHLLDTEQETACPSRTLDILLPTSKALLQKKVG
jgi:hypothetical protein